MDFRLTDQQRLLAAVARDFLEKHCPPTLAQELALDERGFRDDLWNQISALGWPGLLVPAAFGGSDASLADVMLLVEQLGRVSFPSPYVPSAVVATLALRDAGSRAQGERLLPGMALGERICTIAVAEESGSFDPEALALRGEVGGRIDGRKLFVKDAHVADHVLVLVRGGGGFNLLLLETDRAGLGRAPLTTMSGEKLFEVSFDGVLVRADDVVGTPGSGWEAVAPALGAGALARAAEMVGAAQRILDLVVDYAKVRVQSGRPIGSFQAIQHHCADMLRHVEASRALVQHAVWASERGVDDTTAVAMAKAYAGEACLAVARKAHQVFGAIGYCEEHPLHLLHKRIQAASLDFGDRATHLETVSRAIGLRGPDMAPQTPPPS